MPCCSSRRGEALVVHALDMHPLGSRFEPAGAVGERVLDPLALEGAEGVEAGGDEQQGQRHEGGADLWAETAAAPRQWQRVVGRARFR
ncbi:hypothetical protein AY586_02595 [Marichromatium gracile]|uniref:Uncharacterized protein n=1 Tax=Marichromatium gracile TaxID=1048 RepID=A0ABR5VFK2_MARGR|nr:hypothetical protein AY586_02595 [Marichromatium gracile]